jgi:hypothetical protein
LAKNARSHHLYGPKQSRASRRFLRPARDKFRSTPRWRGHCPGGGMKPAGGPAGGQHGAGGGARVRVSLQHLWRHPHASSGSMRVKAIKAGRKRLVFIGRSVTSRAIRALNGGRGRSSREPHPPAGSVPTACGRHTSYSNVRPLCAGVRRHLSETPVFSAAHGQLCGLRRARRFAKHGKTVRL